MSDSWGARSAFEFEVALRSPGLCEVARHSAGKETPLIGMYVPTDSPAHKLDARTKLLGFAFMLAAVFLSKSPLSQALALALVVTVAWSCAAGWRTWFDALKKFALMLVLVAGFNLAFHEGGRTIHLWGSALPFTYEALYKSLTYTLNLGEAIALAMALTFSTSPTEIADGCKKLARPLKIFRVPVDEFALMALLAMRFVPIFQWELRNTVEAQKSRGVDFHSGGILVRASNLVSVLSPALSSAFRRGDALAMAMEARGFVPGKPRSELRTTRLTKKDYLALSIVLLFLGLQVALRNWAPVG